MGEDDSYQALQGDSVDLTPQGCERKLQGCVLEGSGSRPWKMVKMPSGIYLATSRHRMTY